MAKRTWNIVEKVFNEDDLQLYLVQSNVSVKRTIETKKGKRITYRCSKYRKYPACDYQIKIILNENDETTVLTSNAHNHDCRSSTTRVASPVREVVKNATAAGLTPGQARRLVLNQCKTHVSDLQLYSLLKYHRSTIMPDVHSVDDLRSWCNQHSTMIPDPTSLHEPFVPKFYIHSCDDLFVFITTRKLISTAPLSSLLQIDATFKLNWNELPVLVCGSSDGNRRFHPFGIAIIGSNEAASSYITLFQTIKECVLNFTGIQYEVQYLMADGAKGAAIGYPSTNNGLESLNAKRKQKYTLRNKLPLSKFLATMEIMLHDWSIKTVQYEFHTFSNVTVEQEKEAWKWLKDLDKNSMSHWYQHSYIVPSTQNQGYNSSLWLKEYATYSWKSYDDFARWLFAGRLVTVPMMCSCRTNLKTYDCKHALGVSIHFGLYVIPDPSKFEDLGKRRGRPKKAKPALSL